MKNYIICMTKANLPSLVRTSTPSFRFPNLLNIKLHYVVWTKISSIRCVSFISKVMQLIRRVCRNTCLRFACARQTKFILKRGTLKRVIKRNLLNACLEADFNLRESNFSIRNFSTRSQGYENNNFNWMRVIIVRSSFLCLF